MSHWLAHLITQNTSRLIRNASFFSTFDCLEMLHFLAHFLYQIEADHFGSFWSKMEHFWSEMVNLSLSLSLSLSLKFLKSTHFQKCLIFFVGKVVQTPPPFHYSGAASKNTTLAPSGLASLEKDRHFRQNCNTLLKMWM